MAIDGVNPSKLVYACRMIDVADVTDESGNYSEEMAKTAIEELLKVMPELKVTQQQTQNQFSFGAPEQQEQNPLQEEKDKISEIFGNIQEEIIRAGATNTVNYATQFERQLVQKYTRELLTSEMTTEKVKFVNANTVKLPFIEMAGYKDHSRNGGFNRQSVKNDWQTFVLKHDRDVEFFVDKMDVDESNLTLAAANVTNEFETQQDIPETDCYRISKLYAEMQTLCI